MGNKTKYKKDSPTRSILKAISWRFIASGATFIISFVVFRHSTDKTDTQVLQYATAIASVDVVVKLILYYLHERMWTNIAWGKYWTQLAWRRKYRSMHKATDVTQPEKEQGEIKP
ncbi:MAG: DUF2061 domain-containing protein [Bacteroidales bacterium]|nr:DUF2061 domain-containing protein [Bacteroidales bacterium]